MLLEIDPGALHFDVEISSKFPAYLEEGNGAGSNVLASSGFECRFEIRTERTIHVTPQSPGRARAAAPPEHGHSQAWRKRGAVNSLQFAISLGLDREETSPEIPCERNEPKMRSVRTENPKGELDCPLRPLPLI